METSRSKRGKSRLNTKEREGTVRGGGGGRAPANKLLGWIIRAEIYLRYCAIHEEEEEEEERRKKKKKKQSSA
jgi:hypothetical protein